MAGSGAPYGGRTIYRQTDTHRFAFASADNQNYQIMPLFGVYDADDTAHPVVLSDTATFLVSGDCTVFAGSPLSVYMPNHSLVEGWQVRIDGTGLWDSYWRVAQLFSNDSFTLNHDDPGEEIRDGTLELAGLYLEAFACSNLGTGHYVLTSLQGSDSAVPGVLQNPFQVIE